ncbi:MAG: hypothetical protein ACE5K3_02540 [bacterium]
MKNTKVVGESNNWSDVVESTVNIRDKLRGYLRSNSTGLRKIPKFSVLRMGKEA